MLLTWDSTYWKWGDGKKDILYKWKPGKSGGGNIKSDTIEFKTKVRTKDKEGII